MYYSTEFRKYTKWFIGTNSSVLENERFLIFSCNTINAIWLRLYSLITRDNARVRGTLSGLVIMFVFAF